MTKYLTKIISICTFIVLIPVIIAGVALTAVGTTLYNLKVGVSCAEYAVAGSGATENFNEIIKVCQTETREEVNSDGAQLLNGTSVTATINLDNLIGYDFVGWFDSLDKDFANELSDGNAAYTFDIKGNLEIVARVDVKKYNLKFENFDDNVTITLNGDTVEDKATLNHQYKFGEELPVLTAKDGSVTYRGWRMLDGTDHFEKATFKESTTGEEVYTLVPVRADEMQVAYYYYDGESKAWTPFHSDFLTKDELESFQFETFAEGQLKNKFDAAVGIGYDFKQWTSDEQGLEKYDVETIQNMQIVPGGTNLIKIYLQRELKKYTINVKKFDASEAQDTAQMTFDYENRFGALSLSRGKYYEVDGLRYNGADYMLEGGEYGTLADEILKLANGSSIDVVAIWKCKFDNIGFTYDASYSLAYGDVEQVYMGEEHTELPFASSFLGSQSERLYFNKTNGQTLTNLEDSVFETFVTKDKATKFYIMDEEGGYTEVKLERIKIYNGTQLLGDFMSSNITFNDLFDKITTLSDDYVNAHDFRIEFVFEDLA